MSAMQRRSRVNRREFLGALGAGAVAPAMLGFGPLAWADSRNSRGDSMEDALERLLKGRHVIRSDRFGRLFPNLPPFATASPALETALRELGKKGGIMDAKDPLEGDPKRPILLITEVGQTDPDGTVHPNHSANNRNNPTTFAGTTFLGQFIDHDFTFDLSTRLFVPVEPTASPNTRTPLLDLDSVYGGGPDRSPELYQRRGHKHDHRRDHDRRHEHHISRKDEVGPKLKIGSGGKFEDLPRMPSNTAILGDPRNDENIMLSGLHTAIMIFHNNVVDLLEKRNRRDEPDEIFRKARRITTWHYQWIILHEFLPQIIGKDRVNKLLANPKAAFPSPVMFMPVEFQGAAYRMGHSMVRPSYRANFNGDAGGNGNSGAPQFFGMIFDPAGEGQTDPVDLRGTGTRAPRRFIGWQTFFDFEAGATLAPGVAKIVRPNKRLDTQLSSTLFDLPTATIAGFAPDQPTSLPQRNLLRGVTWGLPSGQDIARAIGATPLTAADLSDLKPLGQGLDTSTPLWFYVFREADKQHDGLMLGDVGSNIVGRVFIGALQLDRNSFLADEPNWRPTLPDRSGNVTGNFTMVDFLSFAEVVDRGPGSPGGTAASAA